LVSFWILGQPPRKSNSRRIVYGGQSPRLIKSPEALQWVDDALKQITGDKRVGLGSKDQPIEIVLHIFYKNKQCDLSGELILDTLQKAGVITNDVYVYHLDLYKHFSEHRPGVQVTVRGM
jgi:hypothetical protein